MSEMWQICVIHVEVGDDICGGDDAGDVDDVDVQSSKDSNYCRIVYVSVHVFLLNDTAVRI